MESLSLLIFKLDFNTDILIEFCIKWCFVEFLLTKARAAYV